MIPIALMGGSLMILIAKLRFSRYDQRFTLLHEAQLFVQTVRTANREATGTLTNRQLRGGKPPLMCNLYILRSSYDKTYPC